MGEGVKPFCMWVIVDTRGRLWRRTDGEPVIWRLREDAIYDAKGLDPTRGWRAVKVTVRTAGR